MPTYSTVVTDSANVPVAGAKGYIYVNGVLADLTDVGGDPIDNPITSDALGAAEAVVGSANFRVEWRWLGSVRRVENFLEGGNDSVLRADLADDAAGKGAALVGFKQTGAGAVARTVEDKLLDVVSLLDFVPVNLHNDIRAGTSTTDLTTYFDAALAAVEALPRGGTIYIPFGSYTMDMDLSRTSAGFEKQITIRGAGRSATQIRPTGTGAIILNMLGRNVTTVEDLTIRAGDVYQAACGIYLAREAGSINANNNKFRNIEVIGNFSAHLVVSCAAESSLWDNCRFTISTGGSFSGFWTGMDPAESGVTPPTGTPVIGPNTDNRMVNCEIYSTHTNSMCLTLHGAAAWVFDKLSFIGMAAGSKMVRIFTDGGGIFNGKATFRDCHYEGFGALSVFYVEGTGIRYIYNLDIEGGYCVVDDDVVFFDYDRSQLIGNGGAYLFGCTIRAPAYTGFAAGMPFYCWAVVQSKVWWRVRNLDAYFAVLAFVANSTIEADVTAITGLAASRATHYADAAPTTGTWARGQRVERTYNESLLAPGDVTEWISYAAGTIGTLNGGATTANVTNGSQTITVSSGTGLKVNQMLAIGGGEYRVSKISGTTVTLGSVYAGATASGVAVAYSNATGFSPVGILAATRAATVADPTGGATVDAEARAQLVALIDALQAANLMA